METKNFKGKITGFPVEIIQKMLDNQEKQGNKRDYHVFENNATVSKQYGGFTWHKTLEGAYFWSEVIDKKNFNLFFIKYPKPNQQIKAEYPKIMYVSDSPINIDNLKSLQKRVVFMEKNNKFLAWQNADTISLSETVTSTTTWNYALDVNFSKKELLLQKASQLQDEINKLITELNKLTE